MEVPIAQLRFSLAEEQYYKPEFDNLAITDSGGGEKYVSAEAMKNFLEKMKLSDHDNKKIIGIISQGEQKISMKGFMAGIRLCSLIRQGKKYTAADIQREQKILARRTKPIQSVASPPPRPESCENLLTPLQLPIKIIVDQPVLIQSGWFGTSSYYTYRISSEILNKKHTVTRRFSDLDWIHNKLLSSFKGFIIPQLPDKKIINNTDKAFIEHRRADMEKFLNHIFSHEILGNCQTFIAFLTLDDNEFTRFKEQNIEETFETFEIQGLENTIDKTIAHLQTKFQYITSSFNPTQNSTIKTINDSATVICENLKGVIENFHNYSESWSNQTMSSLVLLQELPNQTINIIKESQERHKSAMKTYEDSLQYELDKTQGLIQAVECYDMSINKQILEQNLVNRIIKKQKQCTDMLSSSRYLEEIEKHQAQIEDLAKESFQIEKNIKHEFSEQKKQKTSRISSLIVSLVATERAHNLELLNHWKDLKKHFQKSL
ncbi:hypothetical protein SteCoe_36155 [Stentor coeruleus]|uniref:PX domain-containing protein n=1 Tax=Stentor coeruleus TaxID=5963 RepID=A0A1R2AQP2_9CILI|nr:hypothetical protein SteCoe_36155 [Stentor coeruleus]